MIKKKLALAIAVAIVFSACPDSGLVSYAADIAQEELTGEEPAAKDPLGETSEQPQTEAEFTESADEKEGAYEEIAAGSNETDADAPLNLPTTADKVSMQATNAETSNIPFTYSSSNGKVTITHYTGSESNRNVVIPSEINNEPVTKIGPNAFIGASALETITIPNSVTTISSGAFSECSALETITIPNSVTSIGEDAFNKCSKLKNITIPDSVTSIGARAFYSCESLTSITLPDSIKSIGNYVFWWCTSLTSITFPSNVTTICDGAFYRCESLTSITIPNTVTSIGERAFQECLNLKSITIPKSVTSIGECAFGGYGWGNFVITIYGYKGSYAEQFVLKYPNRNVVFSALDATSPAPSNQTISANASTVKLKKGQSSSALKINNIANGDYVKSVKSSKTTIVKVKSFTKNGTIKLKAQKKTGTAKLTVTLASGKKITVTVKVQKGTVKTTKISGISKKLTLKKGEKSTLKPVLAPITSQQKVTYRSSNKKVASVSSKGVVTGKKKGTATITIKSGSKKKTCKVTVK